jgi:hypothetical protein
MVGRWTIKDDVGRSKLIVDDLFLYCLDHFQGGMIPGLRYSWKKCPEGRWGLLAKSAALFQ